MYHKNNPSDKNLATQKQNQFTLLQQLPQEQRPFLFFDFDDTLVDFHAGARISFELVLQEFGQELSNEDYSVYLGINKSWWDRLERGEITRDELRIGRIQDFLVDRQWNHLDPHKVMEGFMTGLGKHVVLYPGAQEMVLALKAAGWSIGLISNGLPDVQPQRIALAGLEGIFVPVIISALVGYQKPDPQIFQLAAQKARDLGVLRNGQPIIMIGDNLQADMAGAANVGWKTIWCNIELQTASTEERRAVHGEFRSWQEFPGLLMNLILVR
jgi:HAD superfamily hydrolase (TIGR01549 family)